MAVGSQNQVVFQFLPKPNTLFLMTLTAVQALLLVRLNGMVLV